MHLTDAQYFKAWLPFFLCTTLAGMVAGAIAGGAMGALFGPLVQEPRGILLLTVFSVLFNAPLSYVFFRLFVSRLVTTNTPQPVSVPSRDGL